MLLTEPMVKIIPRMAIPTIIAFLITSIYNLADTYFVSFLGTNATAAVGVNASLDQIIMMTGSLFAVGANSFIARLLGARRQDEADHVLSTAFFLAMACGAVISVLGVTFMHPMVRLLGATDTCEQYAVEYATYVLLAAPFMSANFVMNQCLRAEGSATLSMIGMAFGGILNCILDPIFIFGLNMGVAGASLATAISKLVSFGILIFPYLTHRSLLTLSFRKLKLKWSILKEVLTVGASSVLRAGFAVISGIVLNNIAGRISDSVLAGIGVSNKIMMFPFSIILGFGNGFQPVAGYNWGAKRFDRVKASYRFSSRVALIGAAAMGLILFLFAEGTIRLFSATDPEMQAVGALCIRLQCIALPVHAWVAVVNMLCAGLGYPKHAMLLATSRQGTCLLPIVLPLAYFLGANGVASVQAIADVLTLALAIPSVRYILRQVQKADDAQKLLLESEAILP